ncbi:hypothetical protein BSBH6_04243 [Bacillus subtilis]|nr:hypothetical protein BSBH6_04243 [Bacillus subtilis]RPK19891.1 hypothetical protein BH5_04244 [Bacillus subtilis]
MFSIIIPVYNSEDYISETLDSLINQSLGFENNINVILVDDGSTDNSSSICRNYQKKYPQNIKYIKIKNSGPSVARNIGLRHINKECKFIGFVDSDDKLSKDSLEGVDNFYSMKGGSINVAFLKVVYFENKLGQHKLNYRFNQGTRIIDILKEYKAIHFFIGGAFFRKEILEKAKFQFNENLRYWEDALLINKILLEEEKYGVVNEGVYFYRKRKVENSIVDTIWLSKDRYTDFLKSAYGELIKNSIQKYGIVIPYLQFLIAYHIKLYLYHEDFMLKVLSDKEREIFIGNFKEILKYIEVKYIIEQDMKTYYKEFLLNMKNVNYKHFEEPKESILRTKTITINEIKIKGFNFIFKGHFINEYYEMKPNDRIYYRFLNKKNYAEQLEIKNKVVIWNYQIRDYKYSGFSFKLPLWAIKFKLGLKTDSLCIDLNDVNILKSLGKRIMKYKLGGFKNEHH